MPWELACVFKQVLSDFLSQKEHDEEDDLSVKPAQNRPMEAWTSRYIMKQGFVTPTVPNCGNNPREEIQTISGYVDRAMRHSSSLAGSNRDWDLPYNYPVSLRPKAPYSTTLWEKICKNVMVCISCRCSSIPNNKDIRPSGQCIALFKLQELVCPLLFLILSQ